MTDFMWHFLCSKSVSDAVIHDLRFLGNQCLFEFRVARNEFVDDLLEIFDLQAKSDVDLIELLGILDEYGTFILLRLLTLCVFILHCQSFDGLKDFECFLFAHGYLLFLWLFLYEDVMQLALQS